MGIARDEVQQWHRKGISAARPERSHAISSLFLPPEASKSWIKLDSAKRRMSGIRLVETATSEEEAQAIALLMREALEVPEKRVALVTPDRALAQRVAQHLRRWNIAADDTAGRPLSLTPAGRFLLQLAELATDDLAPVPLVSALAHPLVQRGDERRAWLEALRAFELQLRGPRPAPGFGQLREAANIAGVRDWWDKVEYVLQSLTEIAESAGLADAIDKLVLAGEALAGDGFWTREDGRALSRFIEEIRLNAREVGTSVSSVDIPSILREAMDQIAVRPPYGSHPRVAIYGLLEARMTRADLVVCGGLNEGSWPGVPGSDALLAPAILRALGVPGADFRIGLSAHDLAGLMGAPEVVLSRSARDMDGPTIPSRFLLRIEALLGELASSHRETEIPRLVDALGRSAASLDPYPRPQPKPSAEQRRVDIAVTALDRLLGDPYQFYAAEVLMLRKLDPLDAEPTPAWQGTLAHEILDRWHKAKADDPNTPLIPIAEQVMDDENLHPLMAGLWKPRLFAALEWVERSIHEQEGRKVVKAECRGEMKVDGVRVHGRADRIDQFDDGTLAIVDYKTGKPPSAAQAKAGFALQLGLLGLIARDGDFGGLSGDVRAFEYWSLARNNNGGFGYQDEPIKAGRKKSGLELDEFLPAHDAFLAKAIDSFIRGDDPFTAKLNPDYPGYSDYDQLMRLEEWQFRLADRDAGAES